MNVMVCAPPKCHATRRGCRCPNPWVEFQAQIAAEARQKGNKMSRENISREYKKAKKRGTFLPGREKTCRSNVDLLCKWNRARGQTRIIQRHVNERAIKIPKDEAASKSLLPSFKMDARNDRPCDYVSELSPLAPFAKQWLAIVNNLLPNFRFHNLVLGGKEHDLLALYQERITKAFLLVRIAKNEGQGNATTPLPLVYAAQKHFEKKLGKLVPRVHFAHTISSKKQTVKIIGTDPAQGVIQNLYDDTRVTVDKPDLAQELFLLLKTLRANKLKHGDCHFKNITYRMTADRKKIEYLGLIDFELSGIFEDPAVDVKSVLTEARPRGLVTYLEKAGMHIPQWYKEAEKVHVRMAKKDSRYHLNEILCRMFESSLPPYDRIPMPVIRLSDTR